MDSGIKAAGLVVLLTLSVHGDNNRCHREAAGFGLQQDSRCMRHALRPCTRFNAYDVHAKFNGHYTPVSLNGCCTPVPTSRELHPVQVNGCCIPVPTQMELHPVQVNGCCILGRANWRNGPVQVHKTACTGTPRTAHPV